MKKKILITSLILMFSNVLFGQLSLTSSEKLASLGKIYGYLKYYHPEVAKGTFNWDEELILSIPKVLNATDKESLSRVYIDWIQSLGTVSRCKKCQSTGEYFDKNFDLSWTQDTLVFNEELRSILKNIEKNRHQGENYYVTLEPVGKIKPTNEPDYELFGFPNKEYRLLGLFKYWNIIEYFFPYKYLTDQKWDSVLEEMIPKIVDVTTEKDYKYVLWELIGKTDDSHAWISIPGEKYKMLPVKVSYIENKAVISGFYNDSLATLNDMKLGDVILKLNDKDIQKETSEKLKYNAGSNELQKVLKTYRGVLSGFESDVKLTISRDSQIHEFTAKRYDFKDFNYSSNLNAPKSKSLSDEIGYINMANLEEKDIAPVFESFAQKNSIIIDLRNYPRYIYREFTRFLNTEKKDFCTIYEPVLNYPSRYRFIPNLKTNRSKKAFKGKVILLVNENTQSRSEFTAMAFQTADNVITIGSQTAGADGDVVVFHYLEGYKTALTGVGVLYPDGTETQRKGIKIDVKVKPTISGLQQGRDEVLEKAIEIANK